MVAVLVEQDGAVEVRELVWPAEREVIEAGGKVFEYESTEVGWDGKWVRYYREKA